MIYSAVVDNKTTYNIIDTGTGIAENKYLVDKSELAYYKEYVTGVGNVDTANFAFNLESSIFIGQSYDLFALSRSVLGTTVVNNLSGGYIKSLKVINDSTGSNIQLSLSGANAWQGPLYNSAIFIPKGGYFEISTPTGFPIFDTSRNIVIYNLTSSTFASVKISIIGKL